MDNIRALHSKLQHMTLDELLISQDVSHQDYRRWLNRSGYELYPMTKGMYEEAIVSENPKRYLVLTPKEYYKVCYSRGWTEPRESLTTSISEMLTNNPTASQEYIAMTLGVTQARVSQVARKFGLRKTRKPRKDVTLEEVNALSHLGPELVAKKLDISLSTAYKKMSQCKNI